MLSLKLEPGYPQLSFVPEAIGMVMPGVPHEAAPVAVQLAAILAIAGEQSVPLQQRLGAPPLWELHLSPAAQPPVVSQRHPRVPTMHVAVTPPPPPPEPPAPDDVPDPLLAPLLPLLAPPLAPPPKW